MVNPFGFVSWNWGNYQVIMRNLNKICRSVQFHILSLSYKAWFLNKTDNNK